MFAILVNCYLNKTTYCSLTSNRGLFSKKFCFRLGKMYLVYDKAVKIWQRGVVVGIDKKDKKPIIHLICIDFGSSESVTVDK